MIPLAGVQRLVLDSVHPLPGCDRPLAEALGLVAVLDIAAGEDVPPFDNSAVDGFAVRADDTSGAEPVAPARLVIVGDAPAGRPPSRVVGPGEAIRIMTGAPIPEGADAVVMVEATTVVGNEVLIARSAVLGDHVRRAGGDIRVGDCLVPSRTMIRAAHVGVLASLGYTAVRVHRRPRVGVLSSGDELVSVGPLSPGMIRDSNRPMLLALLTEAGCDPVDLGIIRDDAKAIADALRSATGSCDAVVTSGGVSVGDYDEVKRALERLGDSTALRVAIKPAKPFVFGLVDRRPVFALPGNPVAATVSFELFARPALRLMAGHTDLFRPVVRARAEHPMVRRPDGKLHLDRVHVHRVDEYLSVGRCGLQHSNALSALLTANGLALIPDGNGIAEGELVDVMVLNETGLETVKEQVRMPAFAGTPGQPNDGGCVHTNKLNGVSSRGDHDGHD